MKDKYCVYDTVLQYCVYDTVLQYEFKVIPSSINM